MRHLFGVILDVVALELDELFESESAQCDSTTRVLPTGPSEILRRIIISKMNNMMRHLMNLQD